ncbi:MAG: hypothetical protein COV67_01115 [Nitrospinae bacterium CG11_big_fil_rev_8_21_14_0_20_56_8]|nr:MAG: hypothetical protein COV67_01115 [Nitrospinae bacterium CG11_big_fil_rev_8_21_14_0_20_56_8]
MNLVHFIELLLVVGILIVVGFPLFGKIARKQAFSAVDPLGEEFKHLLVRKEEVLLSIKELEFDFKTDKMSPADYDEMRQKLEGEALTLMERLDELERRKKKGGKS